uniref:C-type lectin domain-containing protein n=1 Tax=Caenorhabditis tropicalis TaxID=1561998 RepID=A0A1I7UU69_9PELO
MKLLFLFLVLLALGSAHRHHRHRGPKKLVKVITVNGPKGGARDFHKSSSSSSSEEIEEEKKCAPGWLSFQRDIGLWCVLVGNKGSKSHHLSQPDAETICRQHGATLTGLQNDEERKEIASEALHQLGELKVEYGGVWLGAETNSNCKTTSCGPLKTFKWTDGHTTGTDGFTWGTDEPDDEDWHGKHACLQQIVMTKTFPMSKHEAWLDSFQNGELDKTKCDKDNYMTRLYACGKLA